MTFNPIWQKNETAIDNDGVVRETVTRAANRLVAALQAAESRTDEWRNELLGYALVESALSDCLSQLATTSLWGRENQIPSDILWQIAGSILKTGWLQQRAREKPLGYAGDYEMLAAIMEDRCCEHPLGRLFDRFFQNQAAPCAVRSRTDHAAHALAAHAMGHLDGEYRIASIGVGTGIDVQRGLALVPDGQRDRMHVVLLDLDEQGLQFAQAQVSQTAATGAVTCVRENLFRLGRKQNSGELLGAPSFLICSGLFDYLDDDAAIDLLTLFWNRLASNGQMMVGNFLPTHPTRAYMEWIGNWYLVYREPGDLICMADAAGIPIECRRVGADRYGVDLFLMATKP